jgi:predicted amidophosphoribosyltransferase
MSVRDFANHPCPVCKSDTLHLAMCCQDCGHKQLHPYEQFENREKRMPAPHVNKKTRAKRPLRQFVQARRGK